LLLLLWSTYMLVRVRASRMWALAAAALVAVDINMILAFGSGLETLPYTALVTAGFALLVRMPVSFRARRLLMPVMTAVALMRIDGFAPFFFVIGSVILMALSQRSFSLRGQLRAIAGGVLVWAAWFGWRFWYYGLPLPTTYYAKALIAHE